MPGSEDEAAGLLDGYLAAQREARRAGGPWRRRGRRYRGCCLRRDELIELRAGAPRPAEAALRDGLLRDLPNGFCAHLPSGPGALLPGALARRERLIPAALSGAGRAGGVEQRGDGHQHTERDDCSDQHCTVTDSPDRAGGKRG